MKRIVFFCALCAILLSSCATVYRPNMTATPLFTEKGQVALEGAYSRDGVNVSAAAAVSPAIAVMATGQFNRNARRNNLDRQPANGNYGEIGVGYFKKVKNKFIVETYAGFGKGNMTDYAQPVDQVYEEKLDFSKIFVQPNIAYRVDDFDFIFTPRVAYVIGTYKGRDSDIVGTALDATKKVQFFSAEPTLTLAYGSSKFKGYFQGGININKYGFITSLYNIGVGIKYNFQLKSK
jgi:hypothetical protein